MVEFLALLVDAQNADMTDMMMAAGVNAARDIEAQFADIAQALRVAEAARQSLRDRDRSRIGEIAVIQSRARNDVAHEADIGFVKGDRFEPGPEVEEILLADVRQHQVLTVRHPDLAE